MRRFRSQFLGPAFRLGLVVRGHEGAGAAAPSVRGGGASVGVAAAAAVLGLLSLGAAPASAADCPNADIRAAQGPEVEALPDCMALEMVSPPSKHSHNARIPSVSADGGRVLFTTLAWVTGPGNITTFTGDTYVASRGSAGWGSYEATAPPNGEEGAFVGSWDGFAAAARSFDPAFERWVTFAATSPQTDEGVGQLFRGGLGGAFSPLSPLLVPLDGFHGGQNVQNASFQGASADHSRVFFKPGDQSTRYLPGDVSPTGSGAEANAYVAELGAGGEPSLSLLARDGGGTIWGGRCGARLGGNARMGNVWSGRDQGAISSDGSRVYFSTRPSQPALGDCASAANGLRIMSRLDSGSGPVISELFAPECDRVTPACSTANGDDLYQGASADGTRVYFTTTRQLADSDLDAGDGFTSCSQFFVAPGCDLYLYDSARPAGERLIQVSAGEAGSPTPGDGAGLLDGITAISADASHAYFVARGALTTDPSAAGAVAVEGQPNLYSFTYDDDNPDGRLAFVGAVAETDGPTALGLWGAAGSFRASYTVPARDGSGGAGDGHMLLFGSQASLTADDTDGGYRDTFRYDADADQLVRVSKAAPGGSDNGPFDVSMLGRGNEAQRVGTDYAEISRWASEDGETAVLVTSEALAAADTDGTESAYLWRDGVPYLLPASSAPITFAGVSNPVLSHDGSTVAFVTSAALLPEDGDLATDVYVARVGGGFPPAEPETVCDPLAGGCQAGGAGTVGSDSKTGSSAGAGNVQIGERKQIAVAGLSARERRRAARSGVLRLGLRSTQTGVVRVVVKGRIGKRTRRVARASVQLHDTGRAALRLPLSRAARRTLRKGRALRLSITVTSPGARSRTTSVRLPGDRS